MRDKSGHFKKGNTEGFVSNRPKVLKSLVGIRLTSEDKEALKNVPNWQERLRKYIQVLISEDGE
ncbi:MAG: hypothetical protein SWZ49_32790 [Cyanobacteriota bacterium]|nr:hypothetical protein [Cyanobacteriota bacterium]